MDRQTKGMASPAIYPPPCLTQLASAQVAHTFRTDDGYPPMNWAIFRLQQPEVGLCYRKGYPWGRSCMQEECLVPVGIPRINRHCECDDMLDTVHWNKNCSLEYKWFKQFNLV